MSARPPFWLWFGWLSGLLFALLVAIPYMQRMMAQ